MLKTGLGSKVLPAHPLPTIDNTPMGKPGHQSTSGLCGALISRDGSFVLWAMVSTFPQLLGGAHPQCPVQRGHKPPHPQRNFQSDL